MTDNQLGEFLRARRAAVRPQDVGLVSYGRRRVAGLRREEVAQAAGINADYYTRLEQGRERNPSAQVLEALSRVLLVSGALRDHLFRLAGVAPLTRAVETVDPLLRRMLENHVAATALVLSPAMDVLAANAMAEAFFSPYPRLDNLARMTFLEPVSREFCLDWTWTCQAMVAGFRQAGALYPDHPRLRGVIDELLTASVEFAELWHSYTLCVATAEPRGFVHPEIGPLRLTYQSFDVRGAAGQRLMLYQPEPGSSAEALARLAEVA
ncbi:helix-turn-helix transcriptional regulator [Nocardia seriolae]|uniref:helix-turn-helix transcriptional regulator n=1 Tax=Nocardia seriolae TaxID=37332 RepID=UPI00119165BC|nr:helix-turn-helix transcriptional regulator [Nocardia seriolae]GEM25370.1 transcriptional regulator [Nocardia seriolae NBRC 15557]